MRWQRRPMISVALVMLVAGACGDTAQPLSDQWAPTDDIAMEEQAALAGSEGTASPVPWQFGDDESFDHAWNACAEGVWEACDELWWVAPPGSKYSLFADTCGNRVERGDEWCYVVMNPDITMVFEPTAEDSGTAPTVAAGGAPPLDQPKPEHPGGFVPPAGAGVGNQAGAGAGNQAGGAVGSQSANDYGDDPAFDALWDACGVGDWAACDRLFAMSPVGSNYEVFGYTCGGRVIAHSNGNCAAAVAAVPVGSDPQDYGDDIHLDALWDSCAAGVWADCDRLFREAVSGSNYHAYGFTCGGRVAYSNGDCANSGAPAVPAAGSPHDYGDDVYLDWLWDGCFNGAWDDCDRLYNDSPSGSNYQAYGGRCGNRRSDMIAQSCQGLMSNPPTVPDVGPPDVGPPDVGPVVVASGTTILMFDRDFPNEPVAYLDLDDAPPTITQMGEPPDYTTRSAKDLFWSSPCDDTQMEYEVRERGTNAGCYVLSRAGSSHFLKPEGPGDYDDCVATLGTGVLVVQPLTIGGHVIPEVGLAQTRLCHLTDLGNISITLISRRTGGKGECSLVDCGLIPVLEISYVTYEGP